MMGFWVCSFFFFSTCGVGVAAEVGIAASLITGSFLAFGCLGVSDFFLVSSVVDLGFVTITGGFRTPPPGEI